MMFIGMVWIVLHDEPTCRPQQLVFENKIWNGIHGVQCVGWSGKNVIVILSRALHKAEYV